MGINLEGIKYYNSLIDELKANGIEPFVTLFHYDLPNTLEEEYQGFLSNKIVDYFVNYAEICFWEFGDRVKNWVTFNEPHIFTFLGYVLGVGAPGRGVKNQDGDPEIEPYIVAFNLLNAHADAYRKYEEHFKTVQKGQVGITLDSTAYKPYRGKDNPDDVQAVEYAYDFEFGWFMEPLTSGNWPSNMLNFVTTPSSKHPQGRALPSFTDEQKKMLIGSYDFLGINYYYANYAQINKLPPSTLSTGYLTNGQYTPKAKDPNGKFIGEPAFKGSSIYLCANDLVDVLTHHKEKCKLEKHIIITENGSQDKTDNKKTYEQIRDDDFRIKYIKWHLDAIKRVNKAHSIFETWSKPLVMGYFVWSFTDSFEWKSGYSVQMGMMYVDFKNGLLRYPKKSAIWYQNFLLENKVVKKVASNLLESRKRTHTDVDEGDEVNGALVKAKPTIEEVQN